MYALLLPWIAALGLSPHRATAHARTTRLPAVLLAHTVTPADLVRTVVRDRLTPARRGVRRLAHTRVAPTLTAAWLTPRLVRAVLALDGVRCGG
jgi:hypothetical protein